MAMALPWLQADDTVLWWEVVWEKAHSRAPDCYFPSCLQAMLGAQSRDTALALGSNSVCPCALHCGAVGTVTAQAVFTDLRNPSVLGVGCTK